MKIRRANQKDVIKISTFVKELKANTTSNGHTIGKEYLKSLLRTGFVFYAESDETVAGVLLANVDARIQFSNILHMFIHPEHNDAGLKESLVNKHILECKKMNVCDIALQTPETELDVLKFYEQLGFAQENKFVLLTKTI